jgi:hypothetical protein
VQHHNIPDARGAGTVQDPGPQHRRESSNPSDLEGHVVPDQSVLVFLSSQFQEVRINPFLFTNVESSFESKRKVTSHGHLGNKRAA